VEDTRWEEVAVGNTQMVKLDSGYLVAIVTANSLPALNYIRCMPQSCYIVVHPCLTSLNDVVVSKASKSHYPFTMLMCDRQEASYILHVRPASYIHSYNTSVRHTRRYG